jgi:uncharacterized protein (DUF2237 family)
MFAQLASSTPNQLSVVLREKGGRHPSTDLTTWPELGDLAAGDGRTWRPSSAGWGAVAGSGWHDATVAGNVLGGELERCGTDPMTGFYRDGCCDTGTDDVGVHTVCAVVTEEFLRFSAQVGNDLVTPRPEFGFPGLRPGDRWCLCASRWAQAYEAGVAPPVVLAASHARCLEWIDLADLKRAAMT